MPSIMRVIKNMNCCQQRCVISCGHGGDGGVGYGNASTALVIMLVNCTRPPLRYDLTLQTYVAELSPPKVNETSHERRKPTRANELKVNKTRGGVSILKGVCGYGRADSKNPKGSDIKN